MNLEIQFWLKTMVILYFAKNIGQDISKNVSGKYSEKHHYLTKRSAIDVWNL